MFLGTSKRAGSNEAAGTSVFGDVGIAVTAKGGEEGFVGHAGEGLDCIYRGVSAEVREF